MYIYVYMYASLAPGFVPNFEALGTIDFKAVLSAR